MIPAGAEEEVKVMNSEVKVMNSDLDRIEKNLDAALIQNKVHHDVNYSVKSGVAACEIEVSRFVGLQTDIHALPSLRANRKRFDPAYTDQCAY